MVALTAPYGKAQGTGREIAPSAQANQAQLSSNSTVTIVVNSEELSVPDKLPAVENRSASVASQLLLSQKHAKLRSSSAIPMPNEMLGDTAGLRAAMDSHFDLDTAAGEHKKYMLVKKKPKPKKIKMEVFKPKMKYKTIKMKVPVKVMKKKKVKGYLVKKEKHEH